MSFSQSWKDHRAFRRPPFGHAKRCPLPTFTCAYLGSAPRPLFRYHPAHPTSSDSPSSISALFTSSLSSKQCSFPAQCPCHCFFLTSNDLPLCPNDAQVRLTSQLPGRSSSALRSPSTCTCSSAYGLHW